MGGVAVDQAAQLIGVAEGCERTVDQANDFAEVNLRWRPPKLVATLGTASAFHHARILQLKQNQFEKFFRQLFFVGDITNTNRALIVMTGQHHHGLQCVKALLGDFHSETIP